MNIFHFTSHLYKLLKAASKRHFIEHAFAARLCASTKPCAQYNRCSAARSVSLAPPCASLLCARTIFHIIPKKQINSISTFQMHCQSYAQHTQRCSTLLLCAFSVCDCTRIVCMCVLCARARPFVFFTNMIGRHLAT